MACTNCTPEERHARHMQALRGLSRGYATGALGELAGAGALGDLIPGEWFPSRSDIDTETERFDGQLNAWMGDYAKAANRLPASLIQQVDDFVIRWRDLRASFYVVQAFRANEILTAQADWNRLRDQVDSYGATSAITPATVTLPDGKRVRADEVPPGISTLDRIVTIAKWGGVIVGGAALLKVASDLGAFKKLGGLVGGLRRTSNPQRKKRRKVSAFEKAVAADRARIQKRIDAAWAVGEDALKEEASRRAWGRPAPMRKNPKGKKRRRRA